MASVGKGFIISIIVGIIGVALIGPLGILIGTFIGGLSTKGIKNGAAVGLATAAAILLLVGIIFLITSVNPPGGWAGFVMAFIIIAMLAYSIMYLIIGPIIGALGGLIGRLIFGRKKEVVPPTTYPMYPPTATSTIICPFCGTPNDPTHRFCSRCGANLQKINTA